MSLPKRLVYFFIGLAIGVAFVYYFLIAKANSRGVEFCYLPNCRVLKDIRTKPFEYSDEASVFLTQKIIDTLDIKQILTDGDVDFDKSNVKTEKGIGKIYFIDGVDKKNRNITFEVYNYSDKAVLNKIIIK
jgi:hypothetical protein